MQDPFPEPSCYSAGEPRPFNDLAGAASTTKPGQNAVVSVYRTKVAGHCRSITITWCRDVLVHGLYVAIEGSDGPDGATEAAVSQFRCKVELRPWHFWRKHGSKRFQVDGKPVDVFWDLRSAKYGGEPEPRSNYYVAVVSDDEVVLLLGDNRKDAYRKTGRRPALIDAALVVRKEQVFGKKRFVTKTKLLDKGKLHEISINCSGGGGGGGISIGGNVDPEMVVKIDGDIVIHVKHLQWKFRGNQSITVNKAKVELYWDVHDWLFSPGPRPALFIFKPSASSSPSSSNESSDNSATTSLSSPLSSIDGTAINNVAVSSGFRLFLYAWKVDRSDQ